MIPRIFICLALMLAACGSIAAQQESVVAPVALVSMPVNNQMTSPVSSNPSFIDMSSTSPGKEISLKKPILLSVILPGAGEYYAGAKFKGQVFMGVEAAIWSGFAAFRMYGHWKEDDYKAYAAAHAGVDNNGKEEDFYDWIGFYDSREEFNQIGRLYTTDRPYLPDTRSYYWQWDSYADRMKYKGIKDASKTAFRNSTFMIGLAVLNRLVSGIDTYRTVRAAGKKVDSISQLGDYKFKISPHLAGYNSGIKITVTRKF